MPKSFIELVKAHPAASVACGLAVVATTVVLFVFGGDKSLFQGNALNVNPDTKEISNANLNLTESLGQIKKSDSLAVDKELETDVNKEIKGLDNDLVDLLNEEKTEAEQKPLETQKLNLEGGVKINTNAFSLALDDGTNKLEPDLGDSLEKLTETGKTSVNELTKDLVLEDKLDKTTVAQLQKQSLEEDDPAPEEEDDEGDNEPIVDNVEIDGRPFVGEELTGTFDFLNGEDEGSEYVWLRSEEDDDDSFTIVIQEGLTYEVTKEDLDRYLVFQITPKNEDGKIGDPVLSDPFGPIKAKSAEKDEKEEKDENKDKDEDSVNEDEDKEEDDNSIVTFGSSSSDTEFLNSQNNVNFSNNLSGANSTNQQTTQTVGSNSAGSLISNTNGAVLNSALIKGNTGFPIAIMIGWGAAGVAFARYRSYKKHK